MKLRAKLGLTLLGFTHCSAFAVNPVSGWYGGVMLGGSYAPKINRDFTRSLLDPKSVLGTETTLSGTAQLEYSILGNVDVSVGHRFDKYRVEGQFLYNNNPYHKISFTGAEKQLVITAGSGVVTADNGQTAAWDLKGSTTTLGLMANAFYDFLPSNPRSNMAPYVGAGVGYAYIINSLSFTCVTGSGDNCTTAAGDRFRNPSDNMGSIAGQAIIGVSYFLDDFANFGMDLRYFSTVSKAPTLEDRTQFLSFNILFNGVFDAG